MYSVTEQFVAWLASRGYAASTRPPKAGSEFVTVERTGGYVADMIDHPTVAVQAWAASEQRAEEMALGIRDALLAGSMPRGVAHVSVESGPYPFYDESTRLPRMQLVLDCAAVLME